MAQQANKDYIESEKLTKDAIGQAAVNKAMLLQTGQ